MALTRAPGRQEHATPRFVAVIATVIVAVDGPVIVAVHVHGNATLDVIETDSSMTPRPAATGSVFPGPSPNAKDAKPREGTGVLGELKLLLVLLRAGYRQKNMPTTWAPEPRTTATVQRQSRDRMR